MNSKLLISIIGSGNVAWHLAGMIDACGHEIGKIVSTNPNTGKELADLLNTTYSRQIDSIPADTDLVLMAIPDDHIKSAGNTLVQIHPNQLVAHTSGAHGIEIFPDTLERAGSFYPLNTFTRGIPIDMSDTPIFIDARQEKDKEILLRLANDISTVVYDRSAFDMPAIHLAAVFANNFTNAMFHAAEGIVNEGKGDLSILQPLIRQTVNKLNYLSPAMGQTGPAIRGDQQTMDKHLDLLSTDEQQSKLYRVISAYIQTNMKNDFLPPEKESDA